MAYHQGAEEHKFSSEDCVLLYQASLVLSFLSLLQPNSLKRRFRGNYTVQSLRQEGCLPN